MISSALVFLAPLAFGLLIGGMNAPDAWYAALTKPPLNPPGWVFGPVWTVLYLLIGWAGVRTWQREGAGRRFQLWSGQLALNLIWSPVFFTLHNLGLALVILSLLWLSILAFFLTSWRPDRLAAWLFVPYLLWLTFAGYLNGALLSLNG